MAEAQLEEAKVLWGQGEGTKGVSIVRHLLKQHKQQDLVRAEALLYTGNNKKNKIKNKKINKRKQKKKNNKKK